MKYIVSKVKNNSVGQLCFVPLFTTDVNRKTKLGKWEAKDLRKRLLVRLLLVNRLLLLLVKRFKIETYFKSLKEVRKSNVLQCYKDNRSLK